MVGFIGIDLDPTVLLPNATCASEFSEAGIMMLLVLFVDVDVDLMIKKNKDADDFDLRAFVPDFVFP